MMEVMHCGLGRALGKTFAQAREMAHARRATD
jgi:hypothetical protein